MSRLVLRRSSPKPLTSGAKAAGRFGKQDFVYLAEEDVYRGPAGENLTQRFDSVEHGMTLRSYWTTACSTCAIKAQCTTGKERRIKRWEHEAVIDAMQARLDQAPEKMGIRRQTVEHPFGTIKAWMGSTHFLTRTLDRVSTEMSLHVLAYNLKRVIQILGAKPLMECDTGLRRSKATGNGLTGSLENATSSDDAVPLELR